LRLLVIRLVVTQAKADDITGQDEDGLRVMRGAESAGKTGKVMLMTDEIPTMRHVLVDIVGGEGAWKKRRFLEQRNLRLA